MKYTKEQFDKLPKWAQSEITNLERSIKKHKQTISELMGEEETNTYISEGLTLKPLPNNSKIEFKVGENQCNNVRVYINSEGLIDINSDSRRSHEMVIKPRASNSFYIKFIG